MSVSHLSDSTSGAPAPRWPERLLRVVLPSDSMRDAIVGDLREEHARDVADVGASMAHAQYWRRVGGIVVHSVFDTLRWRSWASDAAAAELSHVVASAATVRVGGRRGLDAWVAAVALGVLCVGIVANTLLFASTGHGSRPPSVLGVGAAVLALACAVAAALVLCVGPHWLRRRMHRQRLAGS